MKPETRKLRAEEEMVVRAIDVKIELRETEETCTRMTCILTSSLSVPPHLSTYPISCYLHFFTITESVGYLIQSVIML